MLRLISVLFSIVCMCVYCVINLVGLNYHPSDYANHPINPVRSKSNQFDLFRIITGFSQPVWLNLSDNFKCVLEPRTNAWHSSHSTRIKKFHLMTSWICIFHSLIIIVGNHLWLDLEHESWENSFLQ